MLTAKPIAAQVKYDFAQLGNSSFFTKYKMKPTNGIRKHNPFIKHPGLSSTSDESFEMLLNVDG